MLARRRAPRIGQRALSLRAALFNGAMEVRSPPTAFVGRARSSTGLTMPPPPPRRGRGSTVLVAGEAGIGKTRLVSELAARARATGATVLVGRCIDLVGASLPYLPDRRGAPAARGRAAELARRSAVRPRPRARTRSSGSSRTCSPRSSTPPRSPLVLVIEDLHWADASTLDLVAFLDHAVAEMRVVVVATYRSDELRPPHRLRAHAELIDLAPFSRDELETLLEAEAGEHCRPTSRRRSTRVPRATRSSRRSSSLLRRAATPSCRTCCATRCCAGCAARRNGPRRAARRGGGRPRRHLRPLSPRPPRRERRPREALRAAVDEDVLVADPAPSSFRFRHALLAEAVYATLLPGEREDVHARLATALAADPALAGTASAAAELAHHWTVAGRWPEALAASVAAARDAEAVSGLAEALRHLEHALDLWERVPGRARASPARQLDAVLARAAELCRPHRQRAAGGAARAPRDRSDRRRRPNARRAALRAPRVVPPRPGPAVRPASPRSAAPPTSSRASRRRRSARGCSLRSRTPSSSTSATRSRSRSARRRSAPRTRSVTSGRRCARVRSRASISATSDEPTRGSSACSTLAAGSRRAGRRAS